VQARRLWSCLRSDVRSEGGELRRCVAASARRHRRDHAIASMASHESRAGTAEYVSPEVLEGESTTTKCDLWALGCLVFQLSTGRLPFTGATDFLVWEKIVAFADGNRDEVDFTSVSEDVEDLVRRLCRRDPLQRLCGDDLEAHAFFVCPVEDIRASRACVPWTPEPCAHTCESAFSVEYMLDLEAGSYGDNVPTLRESETSVASTNPCGNQIIGRPTPSTRCCRRDRVGSMAWRLTKAHAIFVRIA
jgi:serine/threonine protein kinase